jgi:hypothetical protein
MSKVVVVRYQTTAEAAEENQRLVEQVYAELAATEPEGLRYATFRLADGVSFVHVSILDAEENPLSKTAAFQEFQRELPQRLVEGPTPSAATIVGSYRF